MSALNSFEWIVADGFLKIAGLFCLVCASERCGPPYVLVWNDKQTEGRVTQKEEIKMESYGVIGMHIYRKSASILLSQLCINLHDIPQVPCLFHGMLLKFFPIEEMGT